MALPLGPGDTSSPPESPAGSPRDSKGPRSPDTLLFTLLWWARNVVLLLGLVAAALASMGAGGLDTWQLRLTAVSAGLAAVAVHAEGWRHRLKLQRESMKAKLVAMVAWADVHLFIDPKACMCSLDSKISEFHPYHRVLQKGVGGDKRRAATLQLQVLADFLESPKVNEVFRATNWKWAGEWQRGLVAHREAFPRCTVVFPTVVAAAEAMTERSSKRRFAGVGGIQHLANWCSDFLSQPDVADMLLGWRDKGYKGLTRSIGQLSPVRRRKWRSCCFIPCEVSEVLEPVAEDGREAAEVADQGLGDSVPRLPRRQREGQCNCWDEVDATQMLVRGSQYLVDRCKVLSQPSMLQLVCVDTWREDSPIVHYSVSERPGNIVRRLREMGDNRFLFVTNWLVSPFQFVVIWAAPEDPDWLSSPEGLLLRRFRAMSDDNRNARLKLIPRVVEAPLIVRKSLPETPSIIGIKLPISYFVADGYIEASINVVSSEIGRRTLGLMASSSRWFSVEVYLVIEGQFEDELPERILGGFSIFRLNLGDLPPSRDT